MTGDKDGNNNRILIIDDELEIRRGYRAFLNPERTPRLATSRGAPRTSPCETSGYDFELTEADSGDRALEILAAELKDWRRFAVAIVDVRMPGKIDGLQFIQKAWELDPDLLVVVVTAYQDRSVDEISNMFGARFQDQWDYLSKPFTSGEIVQKARNLVSSWNRRERERRYLKLIRDQQSALVAQEQIAIVGRLARTVGHDLGNILQQVMAKLELSESPESQDLLETVELGASICRDLMTFGRAEGDRKAAGPVRLSVPINRAARLLRHQLKRSDIELRLELDEKATCHAQESRLLQIFANLMTNAIQAMASGGVLTVTVGHEGGQTAVTVTDTGCGIPPGTLTQIFEPLFTTKGEHGNGLGLTVCKRIVESYGGTITVESTVGKGTTVKVRFPK